MNLDALADTVNCVVIKEHYLQGSVSTMSYEYEFTGRPPADPSNSGISFQLFGKSPMGRDIEVGAAWIRPNLVGPKEYALVLDTGHGRWHARLHLICEHQKLYRAVPTAYLNGLV